jgi:energy-coupling factor transporter ATP-binding protein EcfA2
MINIKTLFPDATPELLATLENAPKTLMGVNSIIGFQDSLAVDDPRYVETAKARAEQFEEDFFRTFGYDKNRGNFEALQGGKHVLFFGHIGCGKSTELARLSRALHDPQRYWVVNVNLLALLDPNNVNYCDVWLAVAQKLTEQLGRDNININPIVLKGLENWFTEQVLSVEQVKDISAEIKAGAEVGTGIPFLSRMFASFTDAIKNGSTHRETLRTVVRNTYGNFITALNQLFVAGVSGIQAANQGRQLLIVIDGPDRFRLDDWKKFFVDEADQLTQASCVVVYTAPIALKSSGERLDNFDSLVLPMIKLRDLDSNVARPEAYKAMRQIIFKRAHYSLFDDISTIDTLIEYSGGHLRDALRLLSYVCVAADETPVTRSVIDAAAQRLAADYRDWLEKEQYPVLVEATWHPDNKGPGAMITKLLERNALLEYNHGTWRQPHPVVKLLYGYQKAAQARMARHESAGI